MTKEQEVTKYIEKRIKICNENADVCDDNDFDEEATYLREESHMLETVLNMLKEKDKEMEKKDRIINEIQNELRDHIGFENRLKRENKEPDLFNQGRFYVANNINNILKGKVKND